MKWEKVAGMSVKSDTQHLEFLISQYVDGTLDVNTRKTVEQELVRNRDAREIYRQQQEVQDVLDDYGNRLPWINWDEFDKTLATKLENETMGSGERAWWVRWGKSMSVAAALLIAVGVGYSWRAWSGGEGTQEQVNMAVGGPASGPSKTFSINEDVVARGAGGVGSLSEFSVEMPTRSGSVVRNRVDISPPPEMAAKLALDDIIKIGTGVQAQPSSVTAGAERRETLVDLVP